MPEALKPLAVSVDLPQPACLPPKRVLSPCVLPPPRCPGSWPWSVLLPPRYLSLSSFLAINAEARDPGFLCREAVFRATASTLTAGSRCQNPLPRLPRARMSPALWSGVAHGTDSSASGSGSSCIKVNSDGGRLSLTHQPKCHSPCSPFPHPPRGPQTQSNRKPFSLSPAASSGGHRAPGSPPGKPAQPRWWGQLHTHTSFPRAHLDRSCS